MSAVAKTQGKAAETKGLGAKGVIPPRDRILEAARELFYRHGIRAVGVDAIAETADTNKMTLYRHFPSKDALVAECLKDYARDIDERWDALTAAHVGDPEGEIRAWLQIVSDRVITGDDRGCALANAAVELPEKDHPAKAVIEAAKRSHRERLVTLFRAAGLIEAELLADEVFLLIEGARINLQSVGHEGPGSRLMRMLEALIDVHRAKPEGKRA